MTFADEVAADAPVLSWDLGEGSGATTVTDLSGNGFDGTCFGSPTFGVIGLVPGGTAVSFDGVDDRIQREGAGDILVGASAISLETWINTSSMPPGWTWFASVRGTMPYLTLELTDTGTAYVTLQFIAPATGSLESGVIADGERHHIVVTWDNATQIATLYVDGAEFAATPALGDQTSLPTFNQIAVGDDPDPTPSGPTEAVMQWLNFYDTALSPERVAAHFAAAGEVVTPEEVDAGLNRSGAWERDNIGEAVWTPAVETPVAAIFPQNIVAAQAYEAPAIVGTQAIFDPIYAREPAHRERIVIGGHDVSFFRGIPTPATEYQLVQPFLWGAATIELPQIVLPFEQPGHGVLSWLKKGAAVVVQDIDNDTNEIVAAPYRGIVLAFDTSGPLRIECGGWLTGKASLQDRQMRLIQSRRDAGGLVASALRNLRGIVHGPVLGATTGIELIDWGGGNLLDYLNELVAKMVTLDGDKWTVMPEAGVFHTTIRDVDTIHGTVYFDDARVKFDGRSDLTEEPNRVYASGVTPDGMVVKFGAYPGLIQGAAAPYPMADHSAFGIGTTDADTDTGDGVSIMGIRLRVTGYLDARAFYSTYDTGMANAIKDLQRDARLSVTGTMNLATWRALWDLSVTGYDLRGIEILPAAEDPAVKPFRRSGSGAVIARNPAYDATVNPVDRTIAMGQGTKAQIRRNARNVLRSGEIWRGTIEINTGAIIAGEHTPGDPITDLLRARAIKPGMNLWAPLFAGGIVLHVAGVSVNANSVTLVVSTVPDDTIPVWAAIQRDRDNRNTVHRSFFAQRRSSSFERDNTFDEVGGTISPIQLDPDNWTVFPVVAKQAGTIEKLRMQLSPAREFAVAIFGREISPRRLRRVTNAPLTAAGRKRWTNENINTALDRDHVLLYVAGVDDDPCGYSPGHKSEDEPLTGKLIDDASFPFVTFLNDSDRGSVLWVAVWVGASATLRGGRIMWPSAEEY